MVKKLIYLIITLALFAGAGALVAIAPYHIYTLTLTEGVNTRFLTMTPTKSLFYDGEDLKIDAPADMHDESLYQTFHFCNFELPMPINHPLFFMIPIIKIEGVGPRLGASFQNGKNVELFNFMVERSYKFETTSGDQKLFTLPIFKNYISRKSNEEVWGDLFKKRLSLPSNEGKSFFESLVTLRKVSYNDLVYNLYILYNRRFSVPDTTVKMSFYADKNMGIVELPGPDPKVLYERLYIIEKGLIYPIVIKTRRTDTSAMNYRSKFIREINYKSSSTDSAISIYALYKQIPYNQRVDQQGMTYLYSAWSHDLDNRDFVRVIILFLERGKLNLKYLKPFYEFAYKKFGSTLSSASGYLNETAAEALKRKISEELEGEVKKEADQGVIKSEGQFSTPEDKIKFNLQKAKDKKINTDDSDSSLSIE
ncbi:MAG: hypothetical protein H7336_12465 [Bacteriovorax sp.]|nr:hypothetical protein [Bacteriovorax sp.]